MDKFPTPASDPERWLPIPGYEGLYDVSDHGRVRSLPRNSTRGRILKLGLSGPGYLIVVLCRNGERKTRAVHRLVMETFVGPCPEGQQVRHGPNGRLDNRLSQMCYGTSSENSEDQRRDGTVCRGEDRPNAKLTDQIVLECRRRAAAGEVIGTLAAEHGVNYAVMNRVIHGAAWGHVPEAVPLMGCGWRNRARTHCPKGHPYSEENTYVSPRGDRHCRTCQRAREASRKRTAKR